MPIQSGKGLKGSGVSVHVEFWVVCRFKLLYPGTQEMLSAVSYLCLCLSLSISPSFISAEICFFFLNWHVFDLQYCVSFRCTTMQFSYTYVHWRRTWQPTPVFLPGESQGWEPGGLPSMGSHRVGHYWRDLAAVAVYICTHSFLYSFVLWFIVGWASQVTQW